MKKGERVDIPASSTSSTTSALVGVGLTDRGDLQGVHTNFGIVHLELGVSCIHDIQNTVDYGNELYQLFARSVMNLQGLTR